MDDVTIYDSQDFSVLVPASILSSDDSSDSIEEYEGENEEVIEPGQDSGDSSSYDLDDVYTYEVEISEQIDNLNTNICILNENIKFCVLLLFVVVVGIIFRFVISLFNNVLGLGQV